MKYNERNNIIWAKLFMISFKLKKILEKSIINIWKEKKKSKAMNNNY